ncbi:molecular chaperone [Pseudomonas donghuensis]|uniref:fimbrial biogenesis chaperone n=1 Tax=Pseudomonas donghuensis TaxID=1163398 RepID=UPI002E14FA42|nr:fimbria/pilus periplasmic chaperone [Pseudomonas donghuensis]
MSRYSTLRRLVWAGTMLLACQQAIAGIVITGTRVIYPEGQKEVSVKLNNNGNQPALVQAWTDAGDVHASPTNAKTPFVLSPPVFRVDPSKGQTLRLMLKDSALSADKESVYYLNVLEIPPKAQGKSEMNMLQMAFRSRIKIFYRPTGLVGKPDEAPTQVRWSVVAAREGKGYALQASNPTKYHVSQVGLTLIEGVKRYSAEDGMVAPGETRQFSVKELNVKPGASAKVEFEAINDYGALHPVSTVLNN